LAEVLDQAYNIPSIQVVVFTGGEPTLYPERIKYAFELGFTVRLVTNAWWAGNYEEAKTFLEELHSYGLKELNISYDDFHLPWLTTYGGERISLMLRRLG
jgi:MoaA/NifB/PqqE/SkfB family radical SAM enzyme